LEIAGVEDILLKIVSVNKGNQEKGINSEFFSSSYIEGYKTRAEIIISLALASIKVLAS